MKIGLISDTHGYLDDKVFSYFDKCDEIWHAGDIGTIEVVDKLESFTTLRAVYGNVDGHQIRIRYPEHQLFKIEGLRVWMTHIGGSPPRYNTKIRGGLVKSVPQVFICGHSHILKVMTDKAHANLLYVNPGAAGRHGFHKIRTIIRFEITAGKIHDMQVVELGKRGT